MTPSVDNFKLQTPVAFIIFKRPDTTRLVFEAIRKAKPPKLLVIADGPRPNHADDQDKCATTRAIIDSVDWECEVLRNYSSVNLGCGKRPATGITWVFQQVEEAIILEDDCVPHPTFFRFCEEMLQRYRTDQRVMNISGNNFQLGHNPTAYSYYFSIYNHIWGWASWRRAWQMYDYEMKSWPQVASTSFIESLVPKKENAAYWRKAFNLAAEDANKNFWDYQWVYACWINHGLSVTPSVNLVSNIGFGPEATHTTKASKILNMSVVAMNFPIVHPPMMIRDLSADQYTQSFYSVQGLKGRIKRVFGSR